MSRKKLLFGTAGAPKSTKKRDTVSGIECVKELGLECMEVEFVRGVKMGEKKAQEVREVALEKKIVLSVHAPYYINLNSPDKAEVSRKRIFDSAKIGSICGAKDIVFHAAFYMKNSPESVYNIVKKEIESIIDELGSNGIEAALRPETTGKKTQFGTVEELITLGSELEGIIPCIDFSHIYARSRGAVNSYDSFLNVLEKMEETLGEEAIRNMHIHLSGIEYGKGGERNHRNLRESDFNYIDVLKALVEFNAEGKVVCESPNLEEDAILLKKSYEELSE
ncbi:MAG TPA: hypothetical protein ENH28_07850 [Euryarchaeota archaeon]|nr:endonuclease IV [archaeon BMS3Bbin15]HDL16047.1 hypothetical protein [Euryarchaeota archaeon]